MCSMPPVSAMFQSAPLTEARGDLRSGAWRRCAKSFNPLPSPKQGETRTVWAIARVLRVSIRSPHRSKGRPLKANEITGRFEFQSAPLTEARGDSQNETATRDWRGFNPLPSPKQGETALVSAEASAIMVSIRSPHRSKGRRATAAGCLVDEAFQSAPLTEARGDIYSGEYLSGSSSFNPLPSPKQGETRPRRPPFAFSKVSIRSPHRSKGRHAGPAKIANPHVFQSAPLTEARGDIRVCIISSPQLWFQSAPLTEARGDAKPRKRPKIKRKFQSAPLTEARGDVRTSVTSRGCGEFQSAPLTEARGDMMGWSWWPRPCTGFNPLPSPKQGETSRSVRSVNLSARVSIRSPHRSKGRPDLSITSPANYLFQSAPLTEARGDHMEGTNSYAKRAGFNPLPSPKQGET